MSECCRSCNEYTPISKVDATCELLEHKLCPDVFIEKNNKLRSDNKILLEAVERILNVKSGNESLSDDDLLTVEGTIAEILAEKYKRIARQAIQKIKG